MVHVDLVREFIQDNMVCFELKDRSTGKHSCIKRDAVVKAISHGKINVHGLDSNGKNPTIRVIEKMYKRYMPNSMLGDTYYYSIDDKREEIVTRFIGKDEYWTFSDSDEEDYCDVDTLTYDGQKYITKNFKLFKDKTGIPLEFINYREKGYAGIQMSWKD